MRPAGDFVSEIGKGGATADQERTASEKLVNSVALTLFARVAMVIATGLILPAALWMGNRGVSTIDEISRKLDTMNVGQVEHAAEIRALRVESTAQQKILADHEARVRLLEAQQRVATPIGRP